MPEVPAVPGAPSLVDAVARVFADEGPLVQALPEFEPRESQRQMAVEVAGVLQNGGVLLAEAGTGTGKTLAYLVPAILSGRRVLVSTGTKNLQEQIFYKDLPVLQAALPVSFTATYMKGRGNYLCLHRFDAFRQSGEAAFYDDLLSRLDEWSRKTETGDRAELRDLPEDLPAWNDLSATSENCVGTSCPRYEDCFITRMRQRAAASDLVIVNHHLLCADAAVRQGDFGEVIPECHCAVVDEAHQLEDVATQYFGLAVSNYRIDDLARDGDRMLAAGLVEDADGELRRALDRVRDTGRRFFAAVAACAASMSAGGARPGGTGYRPPQAEERIRVGPDSFVGAIEPAARLVEALEVLASSVALIKQAPEDVAALARRSIEMRDQLAFLLKASDDDYVFYLETRGPGIFLRAAPIDVSAIVRDVLLDRMHATVLTSATLAVGGSFEYVRSRLGVASAIEIQFPSEFDYARQAILYLPPRMADPRSPGFTDDATREILEILLRTNGRAFVLFTSYAMLRAVEARLERDLPFPLLVQGTAPRSQLIEAFRRTPNAVLLATASFWQGVDVNGEALSCVIVDKLPFASPADPVTSARMEAIVRRGGEPFWEYQVPLAILTLQQGLGRLIRHRRDRGVLSVLDPRLRTKTYGQAFLDALPPAPVTSSLDAIVRFLEG